MSTKSVAVGYYSRAVLVGLKLMTFESLV